MYKYALFDLDGTLTDSKPGILDCLVFAFEKTKLPVPPESELTSFIGPPFQATLKKLGLNKEDSKRFVGFYHERFRKEGIYNNTLYPGVEEMLAALKSNGVTLAVATSKPLIFVPAILARHRISDYFDIVEGATLDGKVSEKKDVIKAVLGRGVSAEQAVMIGDRRYDIEGAAFFQMDSIGAGYGYAQPGELHGATYYAGSAQEITKFVLGIRKDI